MSNKIERLEKIKSIARNCYNCDLGKTRKNLVFGEGNADPFCMIVAEGPGRKEDELGRPFVGRSGQLLRKMLLAIGLDPIKDCYIANIIKCRPPGNRDPLEEEIEMCCKYLRKQIEIIKPRLLVLLGKTAVKGLCPNFAKDSVEKLRSMTKSLGLVTYGEIPIMVTYHPSALLRAAWRRVGAKEDFEFLQAIYKEFLDGQK
jgi:DNA polymerase